MKNSENGSSSQLQPGILKNLQYDFPAGVVVFLVAIPLCLGIALASGAPLFSGIIAGFVGGIAVSIFSGSPLGVSGPAAGLAVIVLNAISSLGSFEAFLLAVVLAGIIQFVAGILKAGVIGSYFPSSVIKGMLAAIGIILIIKQIPHAFGYDEDPEGHLGFVNIDGTNTFSELINMFNFISPGALIISISSLAILILWQQPFFKKRQIFKWIQGPLVVVVLGIVANAIFNKSAPGLALSSDHLVTLPTAESEGGFFNLFTLPDFGLIFSMDIWVIAITIAIVASLETLLCVEATDKLDPYKRITPKSRELRAQGIGNVISGMIGGLPVTQVIVRSSANINSGGRTKYAALIHGLLVLICALSIPFLLNQIPYASLAAILLVVGYKLARISLFRNMFELGWSQFVPFVVTIFAILFTDLLEGIGIGMLAAIFFILREAYKWSHAFEATGEKNTFRLVLPETVTFLAKGRISDSLSKLPENAKVEIDISKANRLDHDVYELIDDFRKTAENKNIELKLTATNYRDFEDLEGISKTGPNSKYLNRLLLVIGVSAVITFGIFVALNKRTGRAYYLPKGYEGWVTIRFEKEGAPPLEKVDGVYKLDIPPSGIFETSSKLDGGWARDEHYWVSDGGSPELIPKSVDVDNEARRYIHSTTEEPMSYKTVINALQDKQDTVLWDGAKIDRRGEVVDVRPGRDVLLHFYVSAAPQPFFYKHDSLPEIRKEW